MGRHRPQEPRSPRAAAGLAAAAAAAVGAALLVPGGSGAARGTEDGGATQVAAEAPACERTVRVATAASFAPVLEAVAPTLAEGPDCVDLAVTVADGRAADRLIGEAGADAWIADDGSWRGVTLTPQFAEPGTAGSGTVLATSPLYMVTDPATADAVTAAGGSWLGLGQLLTDGSGTTAALRDPGSWGDGMLAAGAIGEAVWLRDGMDASAEALANAFPNIRTVSAEEPALPERDGEVGLVPEYALAPALRSAAAGRTVLAPADHTAMLRYTWMPLAEAAADPERAAALERVRDALTAPDAAAAVTAAHLRPPDGTPLPSAPELPATTAAPLEVLKPHHVGHVFATWYAADRRADMLVAIDVSGSMADPAPGSTQPLIDLVKAGTDRLGSVLPDDAEFALWEFGSRLDGALDHRVLLPRAPLTPEHRGAIGAVAGGMAAQETGTGLYDTILAAYTSARDGYRDGMPNHVVLFTDGRNQDDEPTITVEQLTAGLVAAQDPNRPVQLTVVTFGPEPEADLLEAAIDPVGGYVDRLSAADEVRAVFMHVAAGGLHD